MDLNKFANEEIGKGYRWNKNGTQQDIDFRQSSTAQNIFNVIGVFCLPLSSEPPVNSDDLVMLPAGIGVPEGSGKDIA